MITSLENRVTIGKVMALGFLLATLVAMLLSAPPAGDARAWGFKLYGQLENGTFGPNTGSDAPVAVKDLANVRSIDGSFGFTLAATQ